jgi:hypothetical protein
MLVRSRVVAVLADLLVDGVRRVLEPLPLEELAQVLGDHVAIL